MNMEKEIKKMNKLMSELIETLIEIEEDYSKLDTLKEDLFLLCKDIAKEFLKEL